MLQLHEQAAAVKEISVSRPPDATPERHTPRWVLDIARRRANESWHQHRARVRQKFEAKLAEQRERGWFKQLPSALYQTSDAALLHIYLWRLPFADEAPFPGNVDFLAHLLGVSRERAKRALDELIELEVVEVTQKSQGSSPTRIRVRTALELATTPPIGEDPKEEEPDEEPQPPESRKQSEIDSREPEAPIIKETTDHTTSSSAQKATCRSAGVAQSSRPKPEEAGSMGPQSESSEPEVEDLVVRACRLIPGLHPKVVRDAVVATSLENVAQQIEWFPHRSNGELERFTKAGKYGAFKSFCASRAGEPAKLKQARKADARDEAETAQRHSDREETLDLASTLTDQRKWAERLLTDMPPSELDQLVAKVRAEHPGLGGWPVDSPAFRQLLRGAVLEQRDSGASELIG